MTRLFLFGSTAALAVEAAGWLCVGRPVAAAASLAAAGLLTVAYRFGLRRI